MIGKIAVDIDDTMVGYIPKLVEHINESYKLSISISDLLGYSHKYFHPDWDMDRFLQELVTFEDSKSFDEIVCIRKSVSIVKELSKDHDLVVITNRANRIREKTLTFLDAIFTDCFSDAIFARADYANKTKGDICTDIGATCLIEDVGDICEDASRKIETVLMMGQSWNRDVQDTDSLHRVKDWKEIQARLSI